jgi:hypothetical protein
MMKQANEEGEKGLLRLYICQYSWLYIFFGEWKMVKCAAPSPMYGMKKYRVKDMVLSTNR